MRIGLREATLVEGVEVVKHVNTELCRIVCLNDQTTTSQIDSRSYGVAKSGMPTEIQERNTGAKRHRVRSRSSDEGT